MRVIIARMKERAERQELAGTLPDEARYLEDWARLTFPSQQVPTWQSIRNGIREEYGNSLTQHLHQINLLQII